MKSKSAGKCMEEELELCFSITDYYQGENSSYPSDRRLCELITSLEVMVKEIFLAYTRNQTFKSFSLAATHRTA